MNPLDFCFRSHCQPKLRCATPSIWQATRRRVRPGGCIDCSGFAQRSRRASTLQRLAADASLPGLAEIDACALAQALAGCVAEAPDSLAAAAHASAIASSVCVAGSAIDAEIFALWIADLALAMRLNWAQSIPLLAVAILHPSLKRGARGRRPSPLDDDRGKAVAQAYGLAVAEAHTLAADLARRAQRLAAVAPNLRARGASRVVDMLLADDAVSPSVRSSHRARRGARTFRARDFQDLWLMSQRVSHFDRELAELPESLRWREWMARVEAAIFAAPRPVLRETLTPLVGEDCRLDDLLADIAAELRARPYEIVFVAGGFQFRTRPRYAEALRSLANVKHAGPPSFTTLEMQALSAIAYQQPITRAELSRFVGHDISRDVLGRLKNSGVIAPGPRAPEPRAPIAWVTTQRFLEVFALGNLRDLHDLETLDAMNVLGRQVDHDSEAAVDDALGLSEVDGAGVGDTMLDQTGSRREAEARRPFRDAPSASS